jgi:enterochelin esterase-like enzyme
MAPVFQNPSALGVLWIGASTQERLIDGIRKASEALKAANVQHVFYTNLGGHSWVLWRRCLLEFAPLLFQ